MYQKTTYDKKEWYKKGDALLHEIDVTKTSDDELALWYVGQTGVIVKFGGCTFCIDPVFNDLAGDDGVSRRHYESPFAPDELTVDFVFCTHAHADHMALPTLAGLAARPQNAGTRFIVPAECIPPMTDAGIPADSIIEATAGTALVLPLSSGQKVGITPVSAAHPVHRKTSAGGDTALSYLIDFSGIRLLHMGDTYLTDTLLADLKSLPAPHLFLPPINGGDYFRTARDCIGNLNAREAATLAVLLGADLTIPTHYDMVHDNTVDPLDFVRELRDIESARRLALPALGERILYRR